LRDIHIIHIFGSSGSGSTTLARAISEKYGFHHIDTDDALWLPTDPPFTAKRTPEVSKALIEAQLDVHPRSVISGEFLGWGDFLKGRVDLFVYLSLPVGIRLARIQNREIKRFGNRVLPGGDMYQAHQDFLEWVRKYETAEGSHRSRSSHLQRLSSADRPVLMVEEPLSIEELLFRIDPFLK